MNVPAKLDMRMGGIYTRLTPKWSPKRAAMTIMIQSGNNRRFNQASAANDMELDSRTLNNNDTSIKSNAYYMLSG